MISINGKEFDVNHLKRASNEHIIEHWFESLFDYLKLNYQSQHRLLKGRPDSLIGDIIIDFKFKINKNDLNRWIATKGKQYVEEYRNLNAKDPSLLLVISEKFIWYYDKDLVLHQEREIEENAIRSLMECLLTPHTINAEQFAILFGINSPIYILYLARLEMHFDEHNGQDTVCFQQWKNNFRIAYHDEKIGKELFLRHSYLSTLIKLILYKEFIKPDEYSRDYFRDLENYFETLGTSLFHYDFFRWVINVSGVCDELFDKLKLMKFEATDIFRTIYQEMIIAGVRHQLGEYYTPEKLARRMVEKSYTLGDAVLDSSCGSGTFLIELLKKIDSLFELEEGVKPTKKWFESVNKIYGFDINPIAILTSKANLILYFKSRREWIEEISINVYLCNSIDPIEFSKQSDILLGNYYNFCINTIDDKKELKIPEEALSLKSIGIFRKLVKLIYNVWEEFENFEDTWDAAIEFLNNKDELSFFNSKIGSTNTLIKEVLFNFFNQLYDLKQLDKDHIWLYILNNLVGIRMLLLKEKMDLIITNPPWLTYKDANSDLKRNLKLISKQYNILPGSENITNIEEAVIFLYKIPSLYLKKEGSSKIAFVMPRSLIVSSQNEFARRFDNFYEIEFFIFNDLVFNIDCCCFFAKFNESKKDDITTVFQKYPCHCNYLDSESMRLIEQYYLEPWAYSQKERGKKYSVKKLIKPKEKDKLLPIYTSYYHPKFVQGADLIPKSLLYCHIIKLIQNGKIAIIEPWISPQAKGFWKKAHYQRERVEITNIFEATLSRKLYPFYCGTYSIFLPLDKEYQYNFENLGPFSRKHWKLISKIYEQQTKKDLFKIGINFRNKLCSPHTANNLPKVKKNQKGKYKVIFPNAKNLVASVIYDPDGRKFIDSTCYYYSTENENEAHYLCGMLNIPDLFESVKIIRDTRHHHKRPLYFNIPRFNKIKSHLEIAKLSKESSKIIENYISKNQKIKLDNIFMLIEGKLEIIREIGLGILNSREGESILKEF